MQTFLLDNKHKLLREVKDYLAIALGLFIYSLGWSCFMLPYQITMGGVTGIAAIVYYATGIDMQLVYLCINAEKKLKAEYALKAEKKKETVVK